MAFLIATLIMRSSALFLKEAVNAKIRNAMQSIAAAVYIQFLRIIILAPEISYSKTSTYHRVATFFTTTLWLVGQFKNTQF